MTFSRNLSRSAALFAALVTGAAIYSVVPACAAAPLPFLNPLFTNDMVLQRGAADPVWGWTDPGKTVKVTLGESVGECTAGADGKWMTRVGPAPVGGPYTLKVEGPQTVTLTNVMVGDVWLCSGQSNMQFQLQGANDSANEIAKADYPDVRLFTVSDTTSLDPLPIAQTDGWHVCTPKTATQFSAVAYFFGRKLNQDLKIPIGLIHSSWGGTIAESWTSAEALKTMPDFVGPVESMQALASVVRAPGYSYAAELDKWYQANDAGTPAPGWYSPQLDIAAWKTMKLPQNWELSDLKNFRGVVWFRRQFDLPDGWADKDLVLHLGQIHQMDTTWVNGKQVGAASDWKVTRSYTIPAALLKPANNVIAIRVLSAGDGSGIYGKPDQISLELPNEPDAQPQELGGDWQYNIGGSLARAPLPRSYDGGPNNPTVLYNGMIAPLVPMAIKGAIWYQGESNADRPLQYRRLLPTMIKDWRSRFNSGNFPFLIVQLAGFMDTPAQPTDGGWPLLREAQFLTTERLPAVGIAAATDIGESGNIHPKNKQEVGRRLALAAEGIAYHQPIEYSGPTYKSMTVEPGAIRVAFNHVGGGLAALGDGPIKGFAIAGDDKKFVWADAKIDGNTVVVSAAAVTNPTAVRYAWSNLPDANLGNKDGLPAISFRTDVAPDDIPAGKE